MQLPCACERCATRLTVCPSVATRASELAASRSPEDVALLARFVAGCQGDAAKAVHVLTNSLLWRHEFGANTLRDASDERWRAIQRYYPMGLLDGRGLQGLPVIVVRLGLCDPTGAPVPRVYADETGEEAWLKSHVWLNEQADKVAPERIVIMDLHNMSRVHVRPASLAMLQRAVAIDQRHYPGCIKRYYLVNAPALLRSVWSVIASWLDPISLDRVRVLGDTRSDPSVAAELRAIVPPDVLPEYVGGEARGCVPVHPLLRAGFTPVDAEVLATLPMGTRGRATAAVPSCGFGAATGGSVLWVRALFYSGVAADIELEAHWLGSTGEPLGVALQRRALAAEYAPSELQLGPAPTDALTLALVLHNEEAWKERTVLWHVEGLERDAWDVQVVASSSEET
tara:strand:- start:376 stop:1569 length:1194 start_codon:yes stop_codon:yes gene_type:complete